MTTITYVKPPAKPLASQALPLRVRTLIVGAADVNATVAKLLAKDARYIRINGEVAK